MSRESMDWLNNNTLIGFTDKRGTAWHRDLSLINGLDNHYAGAIPVEDIHSRLFNWHAIPSTVYVDGGMEFGLMKDESRKAFIRSDNGVILGTHSDSYQGHGYGEWLVEHLASLVGAEAQFANAGLLRKGAVAWVQIEMPENVTLTGGVTLRPFILATTSFDGSVASTYKTGATNVVCDNTYSMFMGEAGEKYKRKHTKNSTFNVLDAAATVNTLHLVAERMTSDIERLLSVDVSERAWAHFVEAHAPIAPGDTKRTVTMAETKRQALTGLWRTDARVAPWQGTAWGVVQAVNTFNEHLAIVRNATREERKFTRAVKDEIATADRETVTTLSRILGRELISA
jgi:phage/plasmid-like protein (TIGR03299 family)